LNNPAVVLLTEHPPPCPGQPTTGLALRHARMARALAERGLDVTLAWPDRESSRPDHAADRPAPASGAACPGTCRTAALADRAALAERLADLPGARPRLVLGYWELGDWLPEAFDGPVVLDHVAPRLLERMFEDRDRLAAEAGGLLDVLARVERVWVGNARQRDLMAGLMVLAGHDCREDLRIDIVPIAGDVAGQPAPSGGGRLKLFHGGRDWPWRDASRWLAALEPAAGDDPNAPWTLEAPAELTDHDGYVERLAASDIALELSEANTERRFSQSFRMTDALCAGVPVICNRWLPLADTIEAEGAGWVLDAPEQLPELLRRLAADRGELAGRAANALALARREFDADEVYGRLAEALAALAPGAPRRALLAGQAPALPVGRRWRRAIATGLGDGLARRLRGPVQQWLARRLADRPRPDRARRAWVILSRPDLFPTDHGAAVRIERTAWGLSFQVDEVLLLTDRRDGYWRYRNGAREWRRFPVWPRIAGWPRAINRVRVMARGVPGSNAFLYLPWVDRGMQMRLMWLIARHPVDVVQGEFPAYARPAIWAARLFGTRAILVEHNIEYRRIAEQEPQLDEAARLTLKALELELAQACDRVVTVSERDRRELELAGVNAARLATIPHGVDIARFDAAGPLDLRRRYTIPADHAVLVYHGIYSYKPNLEAVAELGLSLIPALARAGHPARLVAIGPEPPERPVENVVFTGAIDDLPGHLKGGDLAVIALRAGGGTRMKILDNFAAGVPVISTTKGAEGIPVEHGRELLICDDPDEMRRAVIDLLENPERARALARVARSWVEAFDWREIARRYVNLMGVPDEDSARVGDATGLRGPPRPN